MEGNSDNTAEDDDQQLAQAWEHTLQLSCVTTSSLQEKDQTPTDEPYEISPTSLENLDYFSRLPIKLILKIFSHLDVKSIGRCALVNRKLNEATSHPLAFCDLSLTVKDRKISSKLFHFLMKRSQVVRKLDFSGAYSLDKECSKVFLQFIKQCCQDLTFVRLRYCKIVSYGVLIRIGLCKNLTVMDICHVPYMAWGIFTMLQLNKLVRLDLAMTDISNDFLVPLLKENPNLQELEISHCLSLKLDEIVATVGESNKDLRVWNSVGIKSMTIEGVEHFPKLAQLRILGLGYCKISDSKNWLENIILGCPYLYKLAFQKFKSLSDEELLPILQMKSELVSLSLHSSNVTENICEKVLQRFQKLNELNLTDCNLSFDKVQEWRGKYSNVYIKCKPITLEDIFFR